ncbi:MAG: hypothetical protein U0271_44445 [Polyangiaceae bacterium]
MQSWQRYSIGQFSARFPKVPNRSTQPLEIADGTIELLEVEDDKGNRLSLAVTRLSTQINAEKALEVMDATHFDSELAADSIVHDERVERFGIPGREFTFTERDLSKRPLGGSGRLFIDGARGRVIRMGVVANLKLDPDLERAFLESLEVDRASFAFESADHTFRVLFPEEPNVSTTTVETEMGPATETYADLSFGLGLFVCSIATYPSSVAGLDLSKGLTAARDAMLAKVNAKDAQSRDLKVAGQRTLDVTFKLQDGATRGHMRVFALPGRLVTLLTGGVEPAESAAFMDSFKLMKDALQ